MTRRIPTRPGYRAIAVDFRSGRPRVIQWEKIAKEAPPERARNQDDSRPTRGALAAERQARLFDD